MSRFSIPALLTMSTSTLAAAGVSAHHSIQANPYLMFPVPPNVKTAAAPNSR